ncbi:hypothetical protein COOONC_27539 [Cooperia oncophora]
MYEMLLAMLHHAISKFVPLVKVESTYSHVPPHLKRMIKHRETLWKKAVSIGQEDHSCPWIGGIVCTDEGKAEVLARQFQKSFETTATDVMEDGTTPLFPVMQPVVWFHREDIVKILSRWPSSTSITPDFLPLKFIKKEDDLREGDLNGLENRTYQVMSFMLLAEFLKGCSSPPLLFLIYTYDLLSGMISRLSPLGVVLPALCMLTTVRFTRLHVALKVLWLYKKQLTCF